MRCRAASTDLALTCHTGYVIQTYHGHLVPGFARLCSCAVHRLGPGQCKQCHCYNGATVFAKHQFHPADQGLITVGGCSHALHNPCASLQILNQRPASGPRRGGCGAISVRPPVFHGFKLASAYNAARTCQCVGTQLTRCPCLEHAISRKQFRRPTLRSHARGPTFRKMTTALQLVGGQIRVPNCSFRSAPRPSGRRSAARSTTAAVRSEGRGS